MTPSLIGTCPMASRHWAAMQLTNHPDVFNALMQGQSVPRSRSRPARCPMLALLPTSAFENRVANHDPDEARLS